MARTILFVVLGCLCCAVRADGIALERRRSEEVRVRAGIGNFLAKIAAGKSVTVAYFGGSITAMNGWRNLTTAWLRETNPGVEVREVHASIGGTNSRLGAFRLGQDVLVELKVPGTLVKVNGKSSVA